MGAAALALLAGPVLTGPAMADGWLDSMAKQAAGRAIVNGVVGQATKPKPTKKGEAAPQAAAEEAAPPPAPVVQSDPNVSNEDPFAEPGAATVALAAAPPPPASAPIASIPVASDGGAWPTNTGSILKRPGQMEFDAATIAGKEAFVEFSRYSCNDCEGSRGYDAWARQSLNLTGFGAFEKKLGDLAQGQSITWKGKEADGSITVVSEQAVVGFPCKQLKWELKKRKSGQTASRDGLLCYGKSGDYAASDSWVEVL